MENFVTLGKPGGQLSVNKIISHPSTCLRMTYYNYNDYFKTLLQNLHLFWHTLSQNHKLAH